MSFEEHFGYKAFDGNRKNQAGMLFSEGITYTMQGAIRPGMYDFKNMNGFHMSENLANVFRFFDSEKDGISVAEVRGFGECIRFDDEYNGYFDMYVCENIEVLKFLSREEIIKKIITMNEFEIVKFIQTFKMNEKEKIMFVDLFKNNDRIYRAIQYYQYGNKDIYKNLLL